MATGAYRIAIRHSTSRRLLLTQGISELGDFVGLSALMVLAFSETDSALGPAAVYAARPVLSVLTVLLAGPRLDTVERRGALVCLALAGAAAVGLAAIFPTTAIALLASALLGAIRAAHLGVQAGLMAEVLPEEVRRASLALMGSLNQGAQVVGLASGAALTVALGPRVALLIDAATFIVAAVVLATLGRQARPVIRQRAGSLTGLRFILDHPILRRLAGVAWMCMLGGVLPETLAPAAVDPAWVPITMAASSAGGVVGHLAVGHTTWLDAMRGVFKVQAALGVAFVAGAVAVYVAPGPITFIVANFFIGATAVAMLGVQTAFMRLSPLEHAAQINTTMVVSVGLLEGLGALVAGAIAASLGVAAAYLAVGGAIVFTAGIALIKGNARPVEEAED